MPHLFITSHHHRNQVAPHSSNMLARAAPESPPQGGDTRYRGWGADIAGPRVIAEGVRYHETLISRETAALSRRLRYRRKEVALSQEAAISRGDRDIATGAAILRTRDIAGGLAISRSFRVIAAGVAI